MTKEIITPPRGFHPVPGRDGVLVNRQGEVFFLETGHRTKGGVAGRYRRVSVKGKSGARELCYVHDLVCRTFHGTPKKGEVCCHRNDDRLDNAASNLKWETQSKNIKDTYARGLRKPTTGQEDYQEPAHMRW